MAEMKVHSSEISQNDEFIVKSYCYEIWNCGLNHSFIIMKRVWNEISNEIPYAISSKISQEIA